jgi:hypothetical protein
MGEVRLVFRRLLRAVDRNITSVSGNRTWRAFVIEEFRKGSTGSDVQEITSRLQEARDYAFLLESIREHKVGAAAVADGTSHLARLDFQSLCPVSV